MVMAYLFKNTPLQTNVIVNLTVPDPDGERRSRTSRSVST
jgi:hypothetical protein